MEEIRLYTVAETGKILKVCDRTIRDYIKSGKLEAFKVSNNWRIKHQDLENFVNIETKKG